MRTVALAGLLITALLIRPQVGATAEARTPDATITVSSTAAASALGFTLVEGVLRHRDKVYLLTLRGAQPTAASTGKVYGLGQTRDIEGRYGVPRRHGDLRRSWGQRAGVTQAARRSRTGVPG